MSSILLGPLVQNNTSTKLDDVYNSNLSGKMNIIEQSQSMQNFLQPEFLKQFDDLCFDNISTPVGVNDAYTTINGINTSLQRNLDFYNGYSNFAQSDMHYDVVNKDDFIHNNMTQNTSRRDFDVNANRTQRKLETFTGSFDFYTPKKESQHLFEPMADLTYTHGMPTITDNIQNRYLPSNKNNYGNIPFKTNVRIRPGIENKNQEGTYSVYRVMPKNIDELRSDINQKVTYAGRQNHAVKKGEFRGPDPNITKFKMKDFRETKLNDLTPSRSFIEGPKQTGTYTNVTTMRNENETYNPGNPVNINMGDGPDKGKTRFEPSKKENYLNDNTHAVVSIYNKPVMSNAKSFTAYENQRSSTNIEYEAPIGTSQSSYTIDYNNLPLTTIRELMITNDNVLGPKTEQKSYVFSNDMVLPVTKRQQMDPKSILGPTKNVKESSIHFNDNAKTTQRESTSHSIVSNLVSETKQGMLYNGDEAKATLRPGTSHCIVSNFVGETKQGMIYNGDEAKATLRPGTSHSIVSNFVGETKQGMIYNGDKAKATLRPETSHSIVSNLVSETKQGIIYNGDKAKATLRPETSHSIVSNLVGETKQGMIYNGDEAKATLRPGTSHSIVSNLVGETKQGMIYNGDEAKATLRPGTSHSIVSNLVGETKQGMIYNGDEAKATLRPGTSHSIVSNLVSETKQGMIYNGDKAKATLRPETSHSIVSNLVSENKQGMIYNGDKAKATLRPGTSHSIVSNLVGETKQGMIYNGDEAKPTIKQTTLLNTHIGQIGKYNESSYMRDLTDKSRETIRQQTENTLYIGHANSNNIDSSYVRDLNEKANTTIREQTEESKYIAHAKASDKSGTYVRDLNEKANTTIREQTEETKYIAHAKSSDKLGTYVRDLNEKANTTIREQTEETKYIAHVKASDKSGTYVRDNIDIAKPTIKQTTIVQTPGGRVSDCNMGNYVNKMDTMKTTIKETTLLEDYTGGMHGEIDAPISHEAANNMCIDDRREISTYNRAPNGKSDLNGPYIDRDNVRLNEPILFSYVPQPHKALDHSVTPTVSRKTIEKIYSMSKPIIETSSYYVNPYFINTLKNNPLVNDIYHQKNV